MSVCQGGVFFKTDNKTKNAILFVWLNLLGGRNTEIGFFMHRHRLLASNLLHCVDFLLATRVLNDTTLLPMIALLTVQSSAQTFIHSAILFINTSNSA